jgi:hypothetical protein
VNSKYFEDTYNFFAKTKKIKGKDLSSYVTKVLFSDRVQNEIRTLSISQENNEVN